MNGITERENGIVLRFLVAYLMVEI